MKIAPNSPLKPGLEITQIAFRIIDLNTISISLTSAEGLLATLPFPLQVGQTLFFGEPLVINETV